MYIIIAHEKIDTGLASDIFTLLVPQIIERQSCVMVVMCSQAGH